MAELEGPASELGLGWLVGCMCVCVWCGLFFCFCFVVVFVFVFGFLFVFFVVCFVFLCSCFLCFCCFVLQDTGVHSTEKQDGTFILYKIQEQQEQQPVY